MTPHASPFLLTTCPELATANDLVDRLHKLSQELISVDSELAVKAAQAAEIADRVREQSFLNALESPWVARMYLRGTVLTDKNIDVAEFAHNVGLPVDALTTNRNVSPKRMSDRHLVAVAQICFLLLYSWTEQGVAMWFAHPFPQLEDRAPWQLLDEGRYDQLLELAGSGREMVAT